ncbi:MULTISPECIES: sulfotransferase [unclassified Mesorhizobium]|uniref:tetratricopeptide repeat-containing sulfotransferase family protein n=1 Tax=unclassified Mesorhizobium TaxID=325217 RepID=UPI000FCA7DEC|nr:MULTISPECIES: sulfotransferase [unclassified Mesorhizobium]RUW22526.1 tetratricopeptide repeat protein [Mesorhizobium sp. M4B.F.Ca.ET.013.02.1.1]RVD30328.1 tetratricopeptide repeat protein [Mesorhizobium sp. M4B.F.Ca.ET.017.02.2.1]RVD36678.1 tetratricopeptide repeat protein [Mesorhizobium sp. M4B.F.Ca.ET.019.03.1.1]RWF66249.1 MAG: tetratricopeptide repeat protein [Mesorhizobium sp.]TGQ13210.1 tetratricopeptide repeat protein [Mesorhizobium sp. M4B.F.Ca.ET.215.01.1.1]
MNNRLPPAWSKHLKGLSTPPAKQPQPKPPQARPLQPTPSRAQADDLMLRQALELQKAERLAEAEELCHRVLARTRNHPLALYILGTLGLGVDDELAIKFLARAAAREPRNPYYRLSLGEAYLKVNDHPLAIQHLQRACELKPDLVEALCRLGEAYGRFDKAEMALPLYEKALKIDRNHPLAGLGLASALIGLGRMDEATTYLNEAIAGRVNVSAGYIAFANTRKFSAETPELGQILNELGDSAISSGESSLLHLAAGKILNDLGRYDQAMDHFLKGKALKAREFDIDFYRKRVDSLIGVFDAQLLADKAAYGNPSEVPVFILGMPRSGTTLTEQICSSHPEVHGAGELTKLGRMAASIGLSLRSGESFGQWVRSMTIPQSQALAEEYLSYLRHYSANAPYIVDKLPHNFELVGLIAILFPNARIIHCRRDAIDNCLSCFFSNLQEGHNFSCDLETLGLYYREYDRLMRHWNTVLPGRIFENGYEDLISDQERQSRRLIDHLGLPWNDACLRFFDKAGSVRTISRWQVRQPIYKSSVKHWKNYEGRIQPLIEALGDLAEL